MAGQPPTSPWMGSDYFEPQWQTPRGPQGQRDLAWLTKANAFEALFPGSPDLTPGVQWKETPDQSIRMINHWDNIDGTVERGYSGRSVFFEDGKFREDWQLIEEYARLLGSIRINAISINNVNVREDARWFITNRKGHIDKIKKVNDIFAKYGVKTYISINFAAPKVVGGLKTSDPLDESVVKFWENCAEEIWSIIPDFGGFVVKADAEGEPGPLQYGRTHADGANMLANAVKKFGGTIFWRCFVYNHAQDWRDRKTDRAKAAFDNFKNLDGTFADNVVLQIKNGPIDFQIKEPVSPLFGALQKTNQIVEFQITQEYLGQQQHVVFEAPIFKEVLDWDVILGGRNSTSEKTVAKTVKNLSPNPSLSGCVAVGNVGLDANWTGNKLAQANLFAFARLCWDSSLTSEQIAKEWVELTYFDLDQSAKDVLVHILVTSRDVYRQYTVPLGIGFMCRPGFHYGVDIDGYEYDRWGTYHFADREGIGVDRTKETGSNFVSQYSPAICEMYNSLETCPDEDLLFFHHVPYSHRLKSGETVIQHIYNTHFDGVRKVEKFLRDFKELAGKINEIDFINIRDRLEEQLKEAKQWRDVVNTYFLRKSGIQDERSGELSRDIFA